MGILIWTLSAFLGTAASAAAPAADAAARALDALHQAASEADGARYFSLFTEDAVFLGTDASERWPIAAFKEYASKRFSEGKGWTYIPKERHLSFSPRGDTAWFDETLENAKYGLCRGSGVLRKVKGEWKVAQYNLTVPIPNDLLEKVVGMIRAQRPTAP